MPVSEKFSTPPFSWLNLAIYLESVLGLDLVMVPSGELHISAVDYRLALKLFQIMKNIMECDM